MSDFNQDVVGYGNLPIDEIPHEDWFEWLWQGGHWFYGEGHYTHSVRLDVTTKDFVMVETMIYSPKPRVKRFEEWEADACEAAMIKIAPLEWWEARRDQR